MIRCRPNVLRCALYTVLFAIAASAVLADDLVVVDYAPRASRGEPAESPRSVPESGGRVTYVSPLDGNAYQLWPVTGVHVEILLPDSWMNVLSSELKRELLDRCDATYELLAAVTGAEPVDAGRLRIAFIPGDFGSRSALGRKILEVESGQLTYILEEVRDRRNPTPGTLRYMMIHTFDVFYPGIGYLPDFTRQLVPLLRYYLDGHVGVKSDYHIEAARDMRARLDRYMADPTANWESCQASPTLWCGGSPATMIWAMTTLRVVDIHGSDVLPRYFRELLEWTGPFVPTVAGKNDLHFEALSAAAGADVSCYAEHWKWLVPTPEARARLSNRFGPNPMCADADGDGYSPIAYDLDDGDPLVSPAAVEVTNGIDDDCNGIVDDVSLVELREGSSVFDVDFPVRIRGELSALGEHDEIHFDVPAGTSIAVEARALDQSMMMWWSGWGGSPLGPDDDVRQAVLDPPWGTGFRALAFDHRSLPDPKPGGRYDLRIFEVEGRIPWAEVSLGAGGEEPCTIALRVVDPRALARADEVRFWVTGHGFVGSVPVSEEVTFTWSAAGQTSRVNLRGQLFASGLAVSNLSDPVTCGATRPRRAVRR